VTAQSKIMERLKRVELVAKQANARAERIEECLRLKAPCVGDVHVWVGEDEWCLCKSRVRPASSRPSVDLSGFAQVER
jgi:hypothetical protein